MPVETTMAVSSAFAPVFKAEFGNAITGAFFQEPVPEYIGLATYFNVPWMGLELAAIAGKSRVVAHTTTFDPLYFEDIVPALHLTSQMVGVYYSPQPVVWNVDVLAAADPTALNFLRQTPNQPLMTQIAYKAPKRLYIFPTPEKVRLLSNMLAEETAIHPNIKNPNELSRALLPILHKVGALGYEKVALELVDTKSVFFTLIFNEQTTVHLEIHTTPLQEIGLNCFYSLYKDKRCMHTGHGSIEPIVSEIGTLVREQTEAATA